MTKATAPALNTLTVADIKAAVEAGTVSKADAAAELTRRIDKRAAAGKHPMPFVIEARDAMLAETPAKPVKRTRKAVAQQIAEATA